MAAGIELGGDEVPLRQIQDMLGHSDLKTTRGYLHDTADHINRMGKKIEKMGQPDEARDGGISRVIKRAEQ
jgi:integrase